MTSCSSWRKKVRDFWRIQPLWLRQLELKIHGALTLKALNRQRSFKRGDVVVAGLLGTASGLGEGARQLLERLQKKGMAVGASNLSRAMLLEDFDAGAIWSDSFEKEGMLILAMNPNLLSLAYAAIGRQRIVSHRVVGIWYWELQHFPPSWKSALRFVDEVWAGSHYVAEGLRKIAGTTPVHVVPLPLNVASFLTVPTRDVLPEFSGKTIVYFMYDVRSTHARKNPEAVIKAFRLAAENSPDCVLVIKINNTETWPESEARLAALAKGYSNIHFLHAKFSAEDMKNLMARVDIVISLHRSEGFGLLMAEAMASAKPVIATGWSANIDFMTPESSVLIDYKLIDVVDPQHGYDGYGAKWAEPDIEQAAAALRRLIDSPEERARLGQAARLQIQSYLSDENWFKFLPPSFWDSLADPPAKS
jgi:glycosyltransferase involved in cell wall biosynthesis